MKIRFFKALAILGILTVTTLDATAQMGHVMQGAGAENRGMEGAATGNPLKGNGAMYWNVAGLSRAERSSFSISTEYFSNDLKLSSSYGPMSGSSSSNYGPSFIPDLSLVYVPEDSKWTFGLELESVAGFGVSFNASPSFSNPILAPQATPPAPGGFGAVNSEFMMGQVVFGIAYEVNEKLSLGFAPIISIAALEVDPFPGASPGATGYHQTDIDWTTGYGFHFGILYSINDDWSVGASHKTEQDFKPFNFRDNGTDFSFDMDFPSVTSVGFGYMGIEDLAINVDIRYIDYASTDGFAKDAEFDQTGKVKGFGWDSIWQIAIGAAYDVNENLTVRCGYSHNNNPIGDDITFFNIHAPAIIQDHASIGLSYRVTENAQLHAGWSHGFKNSISGPMYGAAGPIAGTKVTSEMSTDSFMLGFGYMF